MFGVRVGVLDVKPECRQAGRTDGHEQRLDRLVSATEIFESLLDEIGTREPRVHTSRLLLAFQAKGEEQVLV